jgi:hypothetical protein
MCEEACWINMHRMHFFLPVPLKHLIWQLISLVEVPSPKHCAALISRSVRLLLYVTSAVVYRYVLK